MIKVIGLDIAKNVFQVHGIDEIGQPALRRKLASSATSSNQRPDTSMDGPAAARVIFTFGNAAACSHLSGLERP